MQSIRIAGVDLAWGLRRPDGVCILEATSEHARILHAGWTRGNDDLIGLIQKQLGKGHALVALDGPVICKNPTGARPVDRWMHQQFGKAKCGCYPVNLSLCSRPLVLASKLVEEGFDIATAGKRLLVEVYPHPAMVRLFELAERIPYKKGPVRERRHHFALLQQHLRLCVLRHFPRLEIPPSFHARLEEPWSKDLEDLTDAFFCSLIGYWHWLHQGTKSEWAGDLETGCILLPRP